MVAWVTCPPPKEAAQRLHARSKICPSRWHILEAFGCVAHVVINPGKADRAGEDHGRCGQIELVGVHMEPKVAGKAEFAAMGVAAEGLPHNLLGLALRHVSKVGRNTMGTARMQVVIQSFSAAVRQDAKKLINPLLEAVLREVLQTHAMDKRAELVQKSTRAGTEEYHWEGMLRDDGLQPRNECDVMAAQGVAVVGEVLETWPHDLRSRNATGKRPHTTELTALSSRNWDGNMGCCPAIHRK